MADFLIMDDDKKSDSSSESSNVKATSGAWKSKSLMDTINEKVYALQRVKTANKVIFYRLLSTMTNAWVSLVKAVAILEKQEKNPVLKKILERFWEELKEWKKLSECMALFPKDFDNAEIWIIKSWEKTWMLNKSLTDLADQLEKLEWISWKIKSAMIYPAFIVVVVIWVVVIMMVKVVPGLLEIFPSKDALPASTRLLIWISDFLIARWLILVWIIVLWSWAFVFWKATESGRYIFDNLKMKIPVFGDMTQKMVLSKFARIFSGLVWSWVSVVESLRITAEAVWNEAYKQRILLLSQDVASGIKIWESVDWDKLFPDMMVQMIQVWEQTAKLDQTVQKVADFYDEQVDNTIAALNKLLEPFIIVTLAVVVWFIAIAIMQPIMWLADTIDTQ